jgi:histidinol-phosphate aminotransferase
MKIKLPFNVNLAAEIGGLVALENISSVLESVRKIVSERDRVYGAINKITGLTTYPSEANFLFIKVDGDLLDLKNYLENNRIFPRYYNEENSLRLTIGKPEQNDKVINCLNSFMK